MLMCFCFDIVSVEQYVVSNLLLLQQFVCLLISLIIGMLVVCVLMSVCMILVIVSLFVFVFCNCMLFVLNRISIGLLILCVVCSNLVSFVLCILLNVLFMKWFFCVVMNMGWLLSWLCLIIILLLNCCGSVNSGRCGFVMCLVGLRNFVKLFVLSSLLMCCCVDVLYQFVVFVMNVGVLWIMLFVMCFF